MAKAMIENIVDIDAPAVEVFDYASDHTHESEWNPKMRSVHKLTDGPIGKGTKYEMEFVPGRPVVVTCIGFDRPNAWEAVGDTLGMHISLGGQVSATATGTRLILRTEFGANGPMALLLPLVARRMRRELQRDVETIKTIVEAGPTGPSQQVAPI
jgi:Polyketide cyclase / dehydrase and lipid transport